MKIFDLRYIFLVFTCKLSAEMIKNLINNRGISLNIMHVKYFKDYVRYILRFCFLNLKKSTFETKNMHFISSSIVPFVLEILKF